MTDNIFLFCDVDFCNRLSLEKYLNPLLARLPKEKRELLAPFGIRDTPHEYVRSHSIFCRFKKTCTCEKETGYDGAQFVLSDRRPVQPYPHDIFLQLLHPEHDYPWLNMMNQDAMRYGFHWAAGRFKRYDKFEPIWRQSWDTVMVAEHQHSERGATLWQPIGNGLYELAHFNTWSGLHTGLGRIEWDADGNGRLFRLTQH